MSAAANTPPCLGALVKLILTDCVACEGEGYQLICAGTSRETYLVCVACGCEGTTEVCEVCGESPRTVRGFELCGCTAHAGAGRRAA